MQYTLVLNAGSSSLKFSVFCRDEPDDWRLDSRGQIDGIGTSPRLRANGETGALLADGAPESEVRDGRDALAAVAGWLRSRYHGVPIAGVGHRVVHGGRRFTGPTRINPEILSQLRALVPLAPLHQPHNLAAIEAVFERLPGVPQVACFDTSFHRTLPPVAELVPLPAGLCGTEVQRYGFHGLSYEYVASSLPRIAPELVGRRIIVAHLGSGASLCAMHAGRSVDCTFGFTALDGLCMGTRPGSVDPGVILYLLEQLHLPPGEVERVLYGKSGLLGISGISSDMRVLLESNHPRARLAVDYFVYRVVKEIGALAAVLGGVDGVVFTAGVGENSPEIRRRVCERSAWLGLQLDNAANAGNKSRISTPESRISVYVIPANEELMIARHTAALLGLTAAERVVARA